MSSKNEQYDFLCDNGFFEPIKIVVEDNKKQEISCCDNNISDVITGTTQSRKEKFLKLLWNGAVMWDLEDGGLIFIILSLLLISLCVIAFLGAKYGLAVFLIVFQIIVLLLGIIRFAGDKIAEALYLKNKNLHLEQTLYTLDFNLDIISVNLKNVLLEYDNIRYECSVDENIKYFFDNEVFFTPELASDTARIIREKRTEILSGILTDKTNNFLNSTKFFEYAKKYYQIKFLDESCWNRISVYEFLMSRDSFVDFCEFIQATMAAEKKEEQMEKAQNEKCRKIISDVINSNE